MAHVKVKVKIGDTSANGLYKQDSSTVWSQVSPDNDYKFNVAAGKWRVVANSSGTPIIKEVSTGTQNANPKNATWNNYTVTEWADVTTIAVSSASPAVLNIPTPSPSPSAVLTI
tara:strand:+ start:85 stop:426 length:342 start_codon:yes stop_codon:yes gene_type:complete